MECVFWFRLRLSRSVGQVQIAKLERVPNEYWRHRGYQRGSATSTAFLLCLEQDINSESCSNIEQAWIIPLEPQRKCVDVHQSPPQSDDGGTVRQIYQLDLIEKLSNQLPKGMNSNWSRKRFKRPGLRQLQPAFLPADFSVGQWYRHAGWWIDRRVFVRPPDDPKAGTTFKNPKNVLVNNYSASLSDR